MHTESIRTTASQDPWNNDTWTFLVLEMWRQTWVDSCEVLNNSNRFARSRSAPLQVKTREIMIHEHYSFLKRDDRLESIRVRYLMIRLDSNGVDQPRSQGLSSYRPLRLLQGAVRWGTLGTRLGVDPHHRKSIPICRSKNVAKNFGQFSEALNEATQLVGNVSCKVESFPWKSTHSRQ